MGFPYLVLFCSEDGREVVGHDSVMDLIFIAVSINSGDGISGEMVWRNDLEYTDIIHGWL